MTERDLESAVGDIDDTVRSDELVAAALDTVTQRADTLRQDTLGEARWVIEEGSVETQIDGRTYRVSRGAAAPGVCEKLEGYEGSGSRSKPPQQQGVRIYEEVLSRRERRQAGDKRVFLLAENGNVGSPLKVFEDPPGTHADKIRKPRGEYMSDEVKDEGRIRAIQEVTHSVFETTEAIVDREAARETRVRRRIGAAVTGLAVVASIGAGVIFRGPLSWRRHWNEDARIEYEQNEADQRAREAEEQRIADELARVEAEAREARVSEQVQEEIAAIEGQYNQDLSDFVHAEDFNRITVTDGEQFFVGPMQEQFRGVTAPTYQREVTPQTQLEGDEFTEAAEVAQRVAEFTAEQATDLTSMRSLAGSGSIDTSNQCNTWRLPAVSEGSEVAINHNGPADVTVIGRILVGDDVRLELCMPGGTVFGVDQTLTAGENLINRVLIQDVTPEAAQPGN